MPTKDDKKMMMKIGLLEERVWNNEESIKNHFVSIIELESNLRKLNRAFIAVQDRFAALKRHMIQLNKKGGKK